MPQNLGRNCHFYLNKFNQFIEKVPLNNSFPQTWLGSGN